jgi:hypothetical protein
MRRSGFLLIVLSLLGVSCSERPREKVPTTRPEAPATQPATTQTATAPETRPLPDLPPSTYDSQPPYPVQLHVRSPEDEQPGWIRILGLDKDGVASASGTFPEQNRIVVDTQNVKRIEVHVGHLPLAEKKRIMLRIDRQSMEIVRRPGRERVVLERRPTGQWDVVN